jgi:HK97 gp10 family phage protein
MSIEFTGMQEILANLDSYKAEAISQARKATQDSTEDALVVAKRLTPVRTGRLRGGTKIRKAVSNEEQESWELYNDVPYVMFVIMGTRYMRARDFFTPAYMHGRIKLLTRLQAIANG